MNWIGVRHQQLEYVIQCGTANLWQTNGQTNANGKKTNGKPTMKFEKGNRAAKGGRRNPPGGRPTNQQQEIKKAAKEIAQEYIEAHVKPLMETYMGLAAGKVVEGRTAKGKKKFELSVDPSTTRDAVGKLVPDAKVEQGEASRPVQITFLQFTNDSLQLPAKEVSVAIEPVSQENRLIERPELKFYDFAKRRD